MNFAVIVHNCIKKVSEAKQTNKQTNKKNSIYKDTHLGSVNILFCIVWYSEQGYLYITFYEFAVYLQIKVNKSSPIQPTQNDFLKRIVGDKKATHTRRKTARES